MTLPRRRALRAARFFPTPSFAAALAASGALLMLFAASAGAACSGRPGTPNNVKVEPYPSRLTTLRVYWINTASERVWWDIEVTDPAGRVFPQAAGKGGPAGTKKGSSHVWYYNVNKPNMTRCFRIRARTGPFDTGCVSQVWSARVCATTGRP